MIDMYYAFGALLSYALCNQVRSLAGILSAQFHTIRLGQCHRHQPESEAQSLPFFFRIGLPSLRSGHLSETVQSVL